MGKNWPVEGSDYWIQERIENGSPWARAAIGSALGHLGKKGHMSYTQLGHRSVTASTLRKLHRWGLVDQLDGAVSVYYLSSQGARIARHYGFQASAEHLVCDPSDILLHLVHASRGIRDTSELGQLLAEMLAEGRKWQEENRIPEKINPETGEPIAPSTVPPISYAAYGDTWDDFWDRFLEIIGSEALRAQPALDGDPVGETVDTAGFDEDLEM